MLQAGTGIKHELNLAGEQVAQRGRRALVGHMDGVELAGPLEHLGGDMRGAAVSGRAKAELAGICAQIADELGERPGRHRRVDQQEHPHQGHRGHRRQILLRVVRHLAVQEGVDGNGAARGQQEGVAIGGRFGDHVGAHDAVGAGAVIHHHGPLERCRQPGGEAARQCVGGAAGREVDHQPDRFVRPGLRCAGLREDRQR